MAENQQIQYINPIDTSLILYDGSSFQNMDKKQNLYTVSRVLYENVIIYSFKIPVSQKNDDLSALVEIKMYEEAGLDVNKNYKISYIVKKLDFNETDLVEAFALDLDILKQNFQDCIKKTKHIDFLALPFLAFSTFYTNKILFNKKNDVFVYMDKYESFISFYKNGDYISTKSITNTDEIIEKLNTEEIHLSVDELYTLLIEKGLDQTQYEEGEVELFAAIESIFSNILTKIQNVVMHNRSVFDFVLRPLWVRWPQIFHC